MTAIDILVLLLIGGCALFGLLRGFVTETLSLIAWVSGIFAVRLFHASVAELLTPFIGTESGAGILSFILVFGVTFTAGKLIARSIGARTRQSVLGPVDRVLGGGFGAVKGLIGATLAFLAFSLVYDTFYGSGARRPDWLSDSRTYPLLNASGLAISGFLEDQRNR
ncbi:CvpA family protein [Sphingobium aromaticiconvertens]|uniref:CvpA family protein n=1 Tax=Sphingobium aromaticiconvertens TaxID=365341 RepID=UPI0030193889